MKIEFSDGVQHHCDECQCITDEYGYGNHLVRCSRESTHGHDVTMDQLRAENARLSAELAVRTDERDHYAAACSRIDQALAEAREWHDMVEDRPNHNQKVLFWWGKEVMLGVYSEQAMKFYTSGTQMLQARYWKELPNYPKFGNAVAWDSNI